MAPRQLWGTHQFKVGLNYAHSTYDGRQTFLPVEIADVSGTTIEKITFSEPSSSSIDQNEMAWFASDKWTPISRLTLDLGLRFDRDSVTDAVHAAPRAGFQLALTSDGKTMLHGGGGLFYDRVPLMIPTFPSFPSRTVSILDPSGNDRIIDVLFEPDRWRTSEPAEHCMESRGESPGSAGIDRTSRL